MLQVLFIASAAPQTTAQARARVREGKLATPTPRHWLSRAIARIRTGSFLAMQTLTLSWSSPRSEASSDRMTITADRKEKQGGSKEGVKSQFLTGDRGVC